MSATSTGLTLASLPTGRLHDVLAQAGPGPAGGSAAAIATTMASGLVRLVARVSPDWEEAPGIAAQAAALGDRALLLADEDHRVYAHALEQLRAPERDAALGRAPRRPLESRPIAETGSIAAPPPSPRDGRRPARRCPDRGDARRGRGARAQLVHVNPSIQPDGEPDAGGARRPSANGPESRLPREHAPRAPGACRRGGAGDRDRCRLAGS